MSVLQGGMSATTMSLAQTQAFLDSEFPQMQAGGRAYHLEAVGPLSARMRPRHMSDFCAPAPRYRARP